MPNFCRTVHGSHRWLSQYIEPASLNVAESAKISDLLFDKPDGLSVEELAKLSGVAPGKLGQVLRFLATKHIYREGLLLSHLVQ